MASVDEIMQACRLCLVKDQVNVPIFEEHGDTRQLSIKISTCLPVKVSIDDNLPKKICDGCSCKLDMLYRFYKSSASAEKQLLEWLHQANVNKQSTTNTTDIEYPHSIDESLVKQEVIDIDETQANDFASDDLNVPIDSNYLLQDTFEFEPAATSSTAQPTATITSANLKAAPKRKRRAAALKPLPPQANSEDEDDVDAVETKVAKTEHISDDENIDNTKEEPETAFVGVPTDNEQPGPSRVDKTADQAPNLPEDSVRIKSLLKKFSIKKCYVKLTRVPVREGQIITVLGALRGMNSKLKQLNRSKKKNDLVEESSTMPSLHCKIGLTNSSVLYGTDEISLPLKNIKNEVNCVSANNEVKEFVCNLCYDRFSNKDNYFTHMNFHKEICKSRAVWCQGCSKFYSDEKQFESHSPCKDKSLLAVSTGRLLYTIKESDKSKDNNYLRILQNKNMPFLCIYCKLRFNNAEDIKEHLICFHSDLETKFQCLWCNQSCSPLKTHMHKCMLCNKYFFNEYRFLIHIKVYHNKNVMKEEKEPNFACFYCHKRFELIVDIDIHSAAEHVEHQLKYICLICNVILNSFQEHTHANVDHRHTLATYQCSYCFKIFDSYNDIKQHFVSLHSLIREPIYNSLKCSEVIDLETEIKTEVESTEEETIPNYLYNLGLYFTGTPIVTTKKLVGGETCCSAGTCRLRLDDPSDDDRKTRSWRSETMVKRCMDIGVSQERPKRSFEMRLWENCVESNLRLLLERRLPTSGGDWAVRVVNHPTGLITIVLDSSGQHTALRIKENETRPSFSYTFLKDIKGKIDDHFNEERNPLSFCCYEDLMDGPQFPTRI
ncbi:hypothetical protein ILUMI_27230 [Ignelater luminosus]|uniref:Uncharacterized protein n=1 Tax=Ignelater luminosus TaxID=2038154 RepID=A0A8K0C5A4_IGNLU|nr:hypothetical protein ILUMI_27230 [Ignelater luminosus]